MADIIDILLFGWNNKGKCKIVEIGNSNMIRTAKPEEGLNELTLEEIEEFARNKLLPPIGNAKVYEPGRTDVGDYKKALELILELVNRLVGAIDESTN